MADGKSILPHILTLEERKKLTVSGVSDVDSFDEDLIVAYTSLGELTIRGDGLHISHLDVETGELAVDGTVYEMTYSTDKPRAGGFFSRLLR